MSEAERNLQRATQLAARREESVVAARKDLAVVEDDLRRCNERRQHWQDAAEEARREALAAKNGRMENERDFEGSVARFSQELRQERQNSCTLPAHAQAPTSSAPPPGASPSPPGPRRLPRPDASTDGSLRDVAHDSEFQTVGFKDLGMDFGFPSRSPRSF